MAATFRNPAKFGFSGHSIVNLHASTQQNWWTDERIESKVTSGFVASKLRPENCARLNALPASAGDLTDELYIDWILTRARRVFLILVECRVADDIFAVIEDAWNDDDLPLALEDISKLKLTKKPDEQMSQKFYAAQFQFLLRPPKQGQHIDYNKDEVIPLDHLPKAAPAAPLQHWARVRLPRTPGNEYVQRKVALGQDEVDSKLLASFRADAQAIQTIRCPHLAPIWATYASGTSAFLLTDFVSEHTLKSIFEARNPASLSKIDGEERALIVIRWLHCLASAVAALHQQGISHGAISPNNIIIDKNNAIAFADIGTLKSFQSDKRLDRDETYNYGAPETIPESQRIISPALMSSKGARNLTSPNLRMFLRRRRSTESRFSIDSFATGHAADQCSSSAASILSTETRQPSVFDTGRTSRGAETFLESATSIASTRRTPEPLSSASNRTSTMSDGLSFQTGLAEYANNADVYSLGCICLDILSFAVKRKPYSNFVRHRSTTYRTSKWKAPVVDSSFHANYHSILTWMDVLEAETYGFKGPVFSAYPDLLHLIKEMIQQEPSVRPSAIQVKERLAFILTDIGKVDLHCSEGAMQPTAQSDGESSTTETADAAEATAASTTVEDEKSSSAISDKHATHGDLVGSIDEPMEFRTSDPWQSDPTGVWSADVSERVRHMLADVGTLPFLDEEEMDLKLNDYGPKKADDNDRTLRAQRSTARLSSHVKGRLKAAIPALHRSTSSFPVAPASPPRDLLIDLPRLMPMTFDGLLEGEESPKTPTFRVEFAADTHSPLRGKGMLGLDFSQPPLEIPGLVSGFDSGAESPDHDAARQQQRSSAVGLLPDPRDPRNNMRKRKDLEYPSPHPPDYFSYRNTVDGYGLYKQTLREFDIMVDYSEDTKQTLAELDLVGEFWDD